MRKPRNKQDAKCLDIPTVQKSRQVNQTRTANGSTDLHKRKRDNQIGTQCKEDIQYFEEKKKLKTNPGVEEDRRETHRSKIRKINEIARRSTVQS